MLVKPVTRVSRFFRRLASDAYPPKGRLYVPTLRFLTMHCTDVWPKHLRLTGVISPLRTPP